MNGNYHTLPKVHIMWEAWLSFLNVLEMCLVVSILQNVNLALKLLKP